MHTDIVYLGCLQIDLRSSDCHIKTTTVFAQLLSLKQVQKMSDLPKIKFKMTHMHQCMQTMNTVSLQIQSDQAAESRSYPLRAPRGLPPSSS